MSENLTIGFIGNPNCGKTTLFNAYTGANLKVANWPAVFQLAVAWGMTFIIYHIGRIV